MTDILWYLLAGLLFMALALFEAVLERLPLTSATLYLVVGVVLGPVGLALITLDPVSAAGLIERVTEVAVIISLFSAGLKLRLPLRDGRWKLPARLASLSMLATVGLVSVAGVLLLELPLGAAVLLGAVLAPTDPVLASAVQVSTPTDRDRMRFTLTGEAGLNDGTAFPFVMLGLGLLGLHEIGAGGWRWLAVDVVWAIVGGLAIGALLGAAIARLVLYLRRRHRQAVGTDDFLALGLIALSYGVALAAHTYGFLAVFAAGLALGRIDAVPDEPGEPEPTMRPAATDAGAQARAGAALREEEREVLAHPTVAALAEADPERLATEPRTARAYLAQAVLGFSEQLERVGEVAVVVLVGGMLLVGGLSMDALWFAPLLFVVIRPLSVLLGTIGGGASPLQRTLMCWFGVRGIGSLYYLTFAIERGVPPALADRLSDLTLSVIAASVVAHGVSVTPLMTWYEKVEERRKARRGPSDARVATRDA